MILSVEELLEGYLIPIGKTVETLDLDNEAKVEIFTREIRKILDQAEVAGHGTT